MKHILHSLISLHKALGGAWCVEVRNGHGFYQEVIVSTKTTEDATRLAAEFGIALGRNFSVDGSKWWSDGSAVVDGITIRVTGPHFDVAGEVQP